MFFPQRRMALIMSNETGLTVHRYIDGVRDATFEIETADVLPEAYVSEVKATITEILKTPIEGKKA